MFDFLSLRGRFLVTPFIGIVLTLVLYLASNSIIRSHTILFQELHKNNLPQVSDISQASVRLISNHTDLTVLLISALDSDDEERMYLQGRRILNDLHEIEDRFMSVFGSTDLGEQERVLEQIKSTFRHYREVVISAIELSTIEGSQALKDLDDAGKILSDLNELFLELSEQYVGNLRSDSVLVNRSLYDYKMVNIIAAVLLVLMVLSALYFSRRMSADIERINQSLIASRDEAERANQAKSAFLSNMSHELRTPMNAVLGFSQLMKIDDNIPDEHKDHAREIFKAGHYLLDLINEMLDLAKIESSQLDISLGRVELCPLVDECLALVSAIAADHDIKISLTCTDGIIVHADRRRLKQVLLNLLSNAIKYNGDGKRVILEVLYGDNDHVIFRITDTGPGIAPEHMGELFRPFSRLAAEGSTIEGTGIGLALSKRLVELMDGRMGVESELGQGSTFWFELPLESASRNGIQGNVVQFKVK